MALVYCPHCGYKNEYTFNVPTFCGGCGERIIGNDIITPQKKTKKRVRARREEPLDDDETDVQEVPDIAGISVDVDMGGNRVIKGSEIASIEKENIKR